ncbi:MAG: hypothetical protein AAGC95_01450 [Pseudomonadota bacterium]
MPININSQSVKADQTFSHLSREWEKQLGSKAGKSAAAAGGGHSLYVAQGNLQKPTTRSQGELPSLKRAMQINIAEVRAAIDHEHKDLKVGNQKISDYVLSGLKSQNGVIPLSNKTVEMLNSKVARGLAGALCAPEVARPAAGPAPNRAAGSDIKARQEAAEVNHISSNWNKLASGYQIMRNAVAADLKEIAGFMNADQRDAAFGPDALAKGDDIFLSKADDIIARAGGVTTGLTNGAVEGIKECLLTTPQYNVNLAGAGEKPQFPEFAATQALYGKVAMSDSINSNSARLSKEIKNIEKDLSDLKYGNYEQKKSAVEELKSLFKKSRDLSREAEQNQKAVLDDNDPAGSVSKAWRQSIADQFRKLAADIYNCIVDLFEYSDVLQALAGNGVAYEDHNLAQQISSVANLNYTYASSLLPENEKPAAIAADLAPADNDIFALTGDWARIEMGPGGVFEKNLWGPDVLYQDKDFAAREVKSGKGCPVQNYNTRIIELCDTYDAYLLDQNPKTLSDLSKSIDSAIASGNRLRGHMESYSKQMLSESDSPLERNNAVHDILDKRAYLLDKLAVAVGFELSSIANNGVVDNQTNVSNEKKYTIKVELVDFESRDAETAPPPVPPSTGPAFNQVRQQTEKIGARSGQRDETEEQQDLAPDQENEQRLPQNGASTEQDQGPVRNAVAPKDPKTALNEPLPTTRLERNARHRPQGRPNGANLSRGYLPNNGNTKL